MSEREQKYDVIYGPHDVTIEPHFCREWGVNSKGEDVGCYGTNPDHGYSFDEACDEVAKHYQQLADMWKDRTHPDCEYYLKELWKPDAQQEDNQ